MGVAAPRKRSRQAAAPQQISDTLPAPSQRQSQPSETSYTLSSVTETATTLKATPFLPTKLLVILETPTSFSSPVFAATASSSHSSAVALGIVFGVFFGTIIFSFIVWRLCRRRSTPKSSASTWPSSVKATTAMPVRYSSTMRYPQRPTIARIKSGDRRERAAPSEEAEKVHTTANVVKIIQSDAPVQSSKRDSRPVSHGTGRLARHHRDLSVSRHREFPHPGRQAVVDVSSPTTEKRDTHDVHPPERSRHKYGLDDRPPVRGRNRQDDPYHHPPPVIYVAGRAAHERSSRRSHERVPQQHPQGHGQVKTHERRRIRRSQPASVSVVQDSVVPAVHAASVSAPAVPTSTRRYQPPRYESTSSATSSSGLSDNIGEEPPSVPSSSASSSSSSEGGRNWSRRRSRSQSPARVRFTLPSGVEQYLDAD